MAKLYMKYITSIDNDDRLEESSKKEGYYCISRAFNEYYSANCATPACANLATCRMTGAKLVGPYSCTLMRELW